MAPSRKLREFKQALTSLILLQNTHTLMTIITSSPFVNNLINSSLIVSIIDRNKIFLMRKSMAGRPNKFVLTKV